MKSAEIREKFLKYFEKKGHKILPSSSLVPDDPTVLLTLAGMLQFKPVFLGQGKPKYKRATTIQKCVRMIDIENVGKTPRHHTFFEMLGNFSFGDYFKEEAIRLAWELLTREFGIGEEKLSVAVFEKDDEAYAIWQNMISLPKEKIFKLGEDNNFWAAGPTGPCGPCSEIYYDLGEARGCGKAACGPGCDCDRFLEIWNLVFIQYDRNEKGALLPLASKGIDTGMGLERIAAVLQGVESNFETDLFVPLMQKAGEFARVPNPSKVSLRIIADHVRAVAHLICDGVLPENTGRGYVLRRLIRRAVLHGKFLGINRPFLSTLAAEVIKEMKVIYPDLETRGKLIMDVTRLEEEHFFSTLEQGMQLFEKVMEEHAGDKIIPGEVAFKLHDTYGFPVELTKEIASDKSFGIDEKGFEAEMMQQRDRARMSNIPMEKKKELAAMKLEQFGATKFEGYEKDSVETRILAVFPKERYVILEKTPFYGEAGGQVGDTGIIYTGNREARVLDTFIAPSGTIVHEVDAVDVLQEKNRVKATIDSSRRKAIEVHHTATHLLHRALREVLGEHVKQAGSYVGPDKLRFDFNHFRPLDPEEIDRIECMVNQKIREKLKVEVLFKSYREAIRMGATALFGEKYGDKVRVLKIGNYSMELCGGTHVRSTGELLFFKINSESAIGAGHRRIEAVAGQVAKISVVYRAKSMSDEVAGLIREYKKLQLEKERMGGKKFTETGIFEIEMTELESLTHAVDSQDAANVEKFLEHLTGRVEWLKERVAKAQKEIQNVKLGEVEREAVAYLAEMKEVGGVRVLLRAFEGYDTATLRSISDVVLSAAKSGICVLASIPASRDKLVFLIRVSGDLVGKGYSAVKLSEVFCSVVGGRGGGKAEKVEGGGREQAKINEAFEKVLSFLGN